MSPPDVVRKDFNIQAVGAVPVRHADRIVAEMLRASIGARQSMFDQVWAVVKSSPDGNPGAQAKMAERLRAAGGPFLLHVHIEPGKRGRYAMCVVAVEGWDPGRQSVIDAGDVVPKRPWLAGTMIKIVSLGRRRYDQSSWVPLLITHHALSRLVQRSNVRTPWQLLAATRSMWQACFFELTDCRYSFLDGKRVTFDLYGGGNAIAVLNHDDEADSALAVTVL